MKILIKIMIAVVFTTSLNLTAFAQYQESQFPDLEADLKQVLADDPTVTNCRQKLIPLYDLELIDFFNFLEENFRNKSSNSSLSNIAIARYRNYKKALEEHFVQLRPRQSTAGDVAQFTEEFEALQACSEITDAYIDLAKERMIEHIKSSSYQKKATIFVEKYKSVNDKLRDLNLEIAQLYGFFMTFNNKLPGFLNACLKA